MRSKGRLFQWPAGWRQQVFAEEYFEFRCLYRIFVSFFRNQPEYDIAAVCAWRVEKHGLGTVISIILIGVISIGAAFLYFLLLKRLKQCGRVFYTAWCFGCSCFCFNPIFPDVRTVTELTSDTIITTICIYLLYGLFVGYSISFEYNELNSEKLARALGMHRE